MDKRMVLLYILQGISKAYILCEVRFSSTCGFPYKITLKDSFFGLYKEIFCLYEKFQKAKSKNCSVQIGSNFDYIYSHKLRMFIQRPDPGSIKEGKIDLICDFPMCSLTFFVIHRTQEA
jgi:hypothetical protein